MRRILVVANETLAGRALLDEIVRRVDADEAEVLVVCPALNSRLKHWTPEEDDARQAALERLIESLATLAVLGVDDVLTPDGKRRRAEISSIAITSGHVCHAIFGVAVTGPPRAGPESAGLTGRQYEVLQLLGQGTSTADIAEMFHLSTETVRNHVRHILLALGAHSRLEAVAIAHRKGLLEPCSEVRVVRFVVEGR